MKNSTNHNHHFCLDKRGAVQRSLVVPESVDWEITSKCNFQCIHCNVRYYNEEREELSVGQMKRIVDMLEESQVINVSISGGEPLLYPDIFPLLEYLIYKGFSPTLLSNGLLLDRNTIKTLENIGIRKIQISLDGATEKTFELIRGIKKSFKKVISNLENIAQSSLFVQINTVAMKYNISEIPQILEVCLKIGIKGFRVVSFIPPHKKLVFLQPPNKYFYDIIDFLRCKKEELKDKISITLPILRPFLFSNTDALLTQLGEKDELMCEAATVLCTILPSGDVVPCSYFRSPEFIGGNLTELQLKEIWESSLAFQNFRNLGKLPPKCLSCEIKDLCRGGCRAAAFYQKGDLRAPDPRCWVQRMNHGF